MMAPCSTDSMNPVIDRESSLAPSFPPTVVSENPDFEVQK
jgi:hypothetical protein